MFEIRNGIHNIILIYIAGCLLLWHLKPRLMFNENKVKNFGLGKDKTLFSYHMTIIVWALLCFYGYEIYWNKKNNIV